MWMKINAAEKMKKKHRDKKWSNLRYTEVQLYQDIATKFETATKGKKTEKQLKETLQTWDFKIHYKIWFHDFETEQKL